MLQPPSRIERDMGQQVDGCFKYIEGAVRAVFVEAMLCLAALHIDAEHLALTIPSQQHGHRFGVRSYKETVYFGLTARQLVCSLLAVGTAVGLYFALRGVLDRETLGWLCIVGAAPMAAAGFFRYNGLTLEQFLWAWCKTNFLLAGRRPWHSENYLYDLWEKEDKE